MKMKEKYDREGVEYIQDELELAERQKSGEEVAMDRQRGERAHTIRGSRKPGEASTGSELYNKPPKGINMGADNDNQKNPLSLIINAAKKTIGKD